jgi:ribokinase
VAADGEETAGGGAGCGDGRRATIADVARAAGVSTGTVSNVLRGRVFVAEETRARVQAAVAALDYEPAESARSLTSRRLAGPPARRRPDPATPRLTSVGYASVDYIAALDALPGRGERRMAAGVYKAIGGPAANVAAIAAGLGDPWPVEATLLTTLGADQDSDWAAATLAQRGVGVIAPRDRRDGWLNRAMVLVEDDGERTIINEPLRLAEVDLRDFVRRTNPAGPPWLLHIEGYQAPRQIAAMAEARGRGFLTSFAATGAPAAWLAAQAAEVLALFDVVVLHRETLALLPGCPPDPAEALPWLAARAAAGGPWPAALVVTLGARGAAAVLPGGARLHAPAYPTTVRDTTGAGDALTGALLALWLNGAPPDMALRAGCAAGALAVSRLAAQELRPTADQIAAMVGAPAGPAP